MLTFYQEFLRNKRRLKDSIDEISTCAISGAVGTFANIDPRVETYVAKKIRENNEFKKLYPSDDPIGTVSGVTGFANNVKFSPQELIGIRGHAGEEKYREAGRRMELLKESIAKEGYRDADKGGERILIHVREDGVPFITEGNHRMVEAFQSNRPFISADVRYLRGAEEVDGLLNPKRIGLDFGEEK
jgi:hypothetical protein